MVFTEQRPFTVSFSSLKDDEVEVCGALTYERVEDVVHDTSARLARASNVSLPDRHRDEGHCGAGTVL